MNYEELIESRNGAAMAKESMSFGLLYKKMTDGKYSNVIDLREDLRDSLVFCEALSTECEMNKQLVHKNQLHFMLAADSSGLYGMKVEQGSFHTFARLLEDSPAVVAGKNFIINVMNSLLDLTSFLHDQGVFHICYAPGNVLTRKGDHVPMLLNHGSFYRMMNDQEMLYGDDVAFIAPEVLEEGTFDSRADIYSLGKFMEYLYCQSEVPYELKGVIEKATNPDPVKRYQTPEEMRKAIADRLIVRRSVVSLLVALFVALLVFGVYFSLVPERENIEFVKPASGDNNERLYDDDYDPLTELGNPVDTMVGKIDDRKMKEYQAKAEQIFRKQFTREADRILSKIYNDERMGKTERNFMATSQMTMQELVKAQVRLGNDAGLSESRSQLIAGQIIDQVTGRLKSQMQQREKQKEQEENEETNPKKQ